MNLVFRLNMLKNLMEFVPSEAAAEEANPAWNIFVDVQVHRLHSFSKKQVIDENFDENSVVGPTQSRHLAFGFSY